MLRRTLATIAATGIAVVGLAPAASADVGAEIIEKTSCKVLAPVLRHAFKIDDTTTRSDLAKQIRDAGKDVTDGLGGKLVSAKYAGQIADKALACEIVKADPELIPGSSLPDLKNIQDILQSLSS